MGNGQGLVGGSVLSLEDLEKAADLALQNFGAPSQVLMSPTSMNALFTASGFVFEVNPEYRGLPWATTARMTKREHAVAKLHNTLQKLSVMKKLSEEDLNEIVTKSQVRLKKALWARYHYRGK